MAGLFVGTTVSNPSVSQLATPRRIDILIPVYNDWAALMLLLPSLDRVLLGAGRTAQLVVIDDGSFVRMPTEALTTGFDGIEKITVVSLRRNLGHQRAIAIGLAYVAAHTKPDVLIVMDGDGEDDPADVRLLLDRAEAEQFGAVVFAERRRRSEGALFTTCYALYRWLHFVLTGIPVRVGNFSAVPARQLQSLVVVSELWNHYAAAVFKARIPRVLVPTARAHRLSGESQMNFVSLVAHGLSAFSVHSELVGVRLLIGVMVLCVIALAMLVAVIGIRLFTILAIPGWTTAAVGLILFFLTQAVAVAMSFIFLVLHARSQPLFIPSRDFSYFVGEVYEVAKIRAENAG
ncbi:MAG: glycosyltransferase [Vicinamibacterales bacterium]